MTVIHLWREAHRVRRSTELQCAHQTMWSFQNTRLREISKIPDQAMFPKCHTKKCFTHTTHSNIYKTLDQSICTTPHPSNATNTVRNITNLPNLTIFPTHLTFLCFLIPYGLIIFLTHYMLQYHTLFFIRRYLRTSWGWYKTKIKKEIRKLTRLGKKWWIDKMN